MAITGVSFAAQVDDWCKASEARLEAVYKQSCQALVAEVSVPVGAGGNMPVDTGFLRSSGIATEGAPTPIRKDAVPEKGHAYIFSIGQAISVISALKVGEVFFYCFTAAYARIAEYGGENRAGRGFVRLAAQNWQSIVARVAREARSRAGQ